MPALAQVLQTSLLHCGAVLQDRHPLGQLGSRRTVADDYNRGIQTISGSIAIWGCASTMCCNKVVPGRGLPTTKTNGLFTGTVREKLSVHKNLGVATDSGDHLRKSHPFV
jgi:hypothetical protein